MIIGRVLHRHDIDNNKIVVFIKTLSTCPLYDSHRRHCHHHTYPPVSQRASDIGCVQLKNVWVKVMKLAMFACYIVVHCIKYQFYISCAYLFAYFIFIIQIAWSNDAMFKCNASVHITHISPPFYFVFLLSLPSFFFIISFLSCELLYTLRLLLPYTRWLK